MSLVKSKQEFRTILDFSKGKLSKNKIKNSLREAEVLEYTQHGDAISFVTNDIQIGMYQIRLCFYSVNAEQSRNRLKEYGGFRVAIYERHRRSNAIQHINLDKDKRFNGQYWTKINKGYNLRMKHLVDIIMFTNRLNKLKMFL
jgi:hypothetical protein